jgi:hypothetical protein
MKSTMTGILTGGAVAVLLGATSIAAQASYLGYDNGDPGNWNFYQEQHNGASPPASAAVPPAAHLEHLGRGHIVYRGRAYDNGRIRRHTERY